MTDSHPRYRLQVARACSVIGAALALSAGAAADSADVRAQRFANRNAPEQQAAVARDFLDLVEYDMPGMRGYNSPRAALGEVKKLRDEDRFDEALAAFHAYFLRKLRNPQEYGLSAFDVTPFSTGVAGRGHFPGRPLPADGDIKAADQLLAGTWKDVEIGLPGRVNWLHPHGAWEDLEPTEPGGLPAVQLLNATAFNPLAGAYIATGEEKYIRAWVAYLDDWALNQTVTDIYPHPCLVPTGYHNGIGDLAQMIRLLGGLSMVMPEEHHAELLPPVTLARVLGKYWTQFSLHQAMYMRTNTHNWTPVALPTTLLMDEFKAAPILFREMRRRNIEDNAVTQNLRDGSVNQQCPWYNKGSYYSVAKAFSLLEARQRLPGWQELPWVAEVRDDPDWFQEIREHLTKRADYLIRLQTPQGVLPIGIRGVGRDGGTDGFHVAPEAFADSELWKVRKAIENARRYPYERQVYGDSGVRPSYHSEWFPYGGYNIVREGWEPDSGYGLLFCSPAPGAYGGRRSRCNNNVFGLAAFGQDLIVEEKFEQYALMDCPLTVDGLPQDFLAGLTRVPAIAGHKMTPAAAWTEPGYWRWHASDQFNLMEGVYDGPYAQTGVAMQAPDVPVSMNSGSIPLDQTLRGIRHQRWVHFVRDARLWIITDRLRGEQEHAYNQYWYLPLKPGTEHAFIEDEIQVDPDARRVRTVSESSTKVRNGEIPQANVSIHSFSRLPLTYKTGARPITPKTRIKTYGHYDIDIGWKAAGESQVITVIYPRAPGLGVAADIAPRQLEGPNGAVGFEANLPGGGQVQYLAAPGDTPVALKLGNVEATATSLLVTEKGGVVLGCTEISVDGKALSAGSSDFEFFLTPDTRHLTPVPIYRPIAPVQIGPARNVFLDQVEVRMTSKTPGVEIRYTLDGGEPTPQSTLYNGPFALRHSAIVKARAYRPGVTKNPPQHSGTHATEVSRAVFDRRPAAPPSTVRTPQPGLTARYFEDDWRRLWLRLESLESQAETNGVGPFDLSLVPDSNPPLGEAAAPRAKFFAVEYVGYLDVPESGVYTLHAPREYVIPDIDPGYELRVFLGNRLGVHGWSARVTGTHEWYPSTRLHAQGNWSVALEKGLQPLRIVYIDYRTDAPSRLNQPGLNDYIWSGVTPDLKISGQNLEPQPIPTEWLRH